MIVYKFGRYTLRKVSTFNGFKLAFEISKKKSWSDYFEITYEAFESFLKEINHNV